MTTKQRIFIISLILISVLSLTPTTTHAYGGGSIIIGIGPRIEAHHIPERMEEIRQRLQKRKEEIQKTLDRIGDRLNLFLRIR